MITSIRHFRSATASILLISLVVYVNATFAQESYFSASDEDEETLVNQLLLDSELADSLVTFSLMDYMLWVKANHPISRQAALLPERGDANLRLARGGFDPKLFGEYEDKYFKEINYWRIFEGGLKIPTTLGIELKTGYSWNDGEFLNSERSIPSQGQAFLGAKIPLGQGLWIDGRRAALRQAKIFTELARIEQIQLLNQLYFEATSAYGNWSYAYAQFRLFNRAVEVSERRFEAIKATFEAGDYPGIDTVEALTQLQQFQLLRSQAALAFYQEQLTLTNYLWSNEGKPMELAEYVRPTDLSGISTMNTVNLDSLDQLLQVLDRHPDIRALTLSLANLEVERKLKADKLKPKLNLSYTYLSPATSFTESLESDRTVEIGENYKWGLELDIPLFYRKERGNLALTRLKIQETQLKQDQKIQELKNKIQSYFVEMNLLEEQVILYQSAVSNYTRLVRAEEIKFRAGESTLFLINSRQSKQIDAEAKLNELQQKRFKANMAFTWISGLLWQTF